MWVRWQVGEKVRKAGARLPGMGQPDVTYPAAFAGRWKATRSLAALPATPEWRKGLVHLKEMVKKVNF